jgi:hypothetical protein
VNEHILRRVGGRAYLEGDGAQWRSSNHMGSGKHPPSVRDYGAATSTGTGKYLPHSSELRLVRQAYVQAVGDIMAAHNAPRRLG